MLCVCVFSLSVLILISLTASITSSLLVPPCVRKGRKEKKRGRDSRICQMRHPLYLCFFYYSNILFKFEMFGGGAQVLGSAWI